MSGEELSSAARAYGAFRDVLGSDTDSVLVGLFGADVFRVDDAAEEWFAAHPEGSGAPSTDES